MKVRITKSGRECHAESWWSRNGITIANDVKVFEPNAGLPVKYKKVVLKDEFIEARCTTYETTTNEEN